MANNYEQILSADTAIAKYISDVMSVKNDPGNIQRVIGKHIRDVSNGRYNLVDPTNPLVVLLEASVNNTVACIVDNSVTTRRQYASVSQTEEDLYLHMSDKDYIDRFASSASTTFTIAINKAELISSLVLDTATGIHKLTIPRNTVFTVNDVAFSLQYPVDIKQLAHGGLEIVYNTTKASPLQTLTTNAVSWNIRKLTTTKEEWVFIEVDVQQFDIVSYLDTTSVSSSLVKKFRFNDKFSYVRIYQKSNSTNNEWVELRTTHNDQNYDITEPTATIKVIGNLVYVTIPQIYITNNLVRGDLRVDIYQTKGVINISSANFSQSAFAVNWKAIDKTEYTPFTTPLSSLRTVFVYCDKHINGGKEPLTFEQLRSRVIRNSVGSKQLPITNVQIATALENEGYEVVKNIDVVTKRVFLATKALPRPFDEKLITPAATSMETVVISMVDVAQHPFVKNNGSRITLTPDILYRNINSVITPLSSDDIGDHKQLDPDVLADKVNTNTYLYTPFHYVIDNSGLELDVRPYYLDKPNSSYVTFVSQNDTTLLQVNTKTHSLTKTSTGYKLRVVTKGNDTYKALSNSLVQAQLSFRPQGETLRAYLNSYNVFSNKDNEKVFDFNIETNLDIDNEDKLILNNLSMLDLENRKIKTDLLNSFDIFYTTSAVVRAGWTPSNIDNIIGKFILPNNSTGITNDKIELRFGYSLKTLWSRSRPMVIASNTQTYSTNIPLRYEQNVYETDPTTGLDFTLEADGSMKYNRLLHNAGDIVYNQTNGNVVYKHLAGGPMLGAQTNNKISCELDMMFIEGSYYFATDPASSTYRQEIVDSVVQWLNGDITRLSKQLLDNSVIYFYPKTSMGTIEVMVSDGIITTIEAGQSFTLELYVNKAVYNNESLRDNITNTSILVIDSCLKKALVSLDDIISTLKTNLGSDVLAINLSGLGANRDIPAFTVVNNENRASLKKKLISLPNKSLIVTEDVTVKFIEHVLAQ